jgi:hypothetical protein
VLEYAARLMGASRAALRALGDGAFFARWLRIVYSSMTGGDLVALNAASVRSVLEALNAFGSGSDGDGDGDGQVVEVESLWVWARDVMSMASMDGLLGRRRNPFRLDPGLTESYW